MAKAQSVIANFNAMLKSKAAGRSGENDLSTDSARRRDPDATDFHVRFLRHFSSLKQTPQLIHLLQAIIYINDYPQKARWKVTNKETMVQVSRLASLAARFPKLKSTTFHTACREYWSIHH